MVTVSSSSSNSDFEKRLPHDTHGQIVLERHNGLALLLRYWVHVAAIVVTVTIAAINLSSVPLMSSESASTNVILNLFQFVAKAHELLIMASLSLILLDTVRSHLTADTGVPLGYLLSPALFNDLGWLTNRHFWSCINATSRTLPLALLVIAAVMFANLSGPLSAITVVPRLAWSQSRPAAIDPIFWSASAKSISSTDVAASSLPPYCSTSAALNTTNCPAGSLSEVFVVNDSEQNTGLSCTRLGTDVSCNATMSMNALTIQRPLSLDYNLESLSIFTSTPLAIIFEDNAVRFQLGVADSSLKVAGTEHIDADRTVLVSMDFIANDIMYKPIVNTTCQQLNYTETFLLTTQQGVSPDFSTPLVSWLHDADGSSIPSFVFTFMKNDTSLQVAETCEGQACFVAIACSIDARLTPFRMWANTAQPSFLFQNDPQPGRLFNSPRINQAEQITIRKDWLEMYTTPPQNTTFGQMLSQVLNRWGSPIEGEPPAQIHGSSKQARIQPTNFTQGVAAFLGSVIAESLARIEGSSGFASVYNGDCSTAIPPFVFPKEVCQQDISHWVHATDLGDLASDYSMMSYTMQESVYGWYINSVTVFIALVVLLLHALLTVLYLVHTLLFRKTITRCWDTAPEMLILALNSLRAPSLMGSSTRIKDSSLWREPVTVRQVAGDDDLSLIVGDPRYYSGLAGHLPEVGKKYD